MMKKDTQKFGYRLVTFMLKPNMSGNVNGTIIKIEKISVQIMTIKVIM